MISLIERMARDYRRVIKRTQKAVGYTQDASISSQMRIELNALSEKWSKEFVQASQVHVPKFFESVSKDSKRRLIDSLGAMAGVSISVPDMPASLQDIVKASITENVGLVRSVGNQFRERVEGAVMRSISQGGGGTHDVFKYLTKVEGMATKRAKLIATDQNRKATTAFNTERMKSTNIRKWEWVHSGGGAEPRALHKKLNRQVFSFDDPPPIIDERTGERGYPGQLIHCRCIMRPVFDFEE